MIEAIVAVYQDWGIGAYGTQPVVVSADRKHFRNVTGGSAVIVGRKTLADFPGGKPLKNRINIVLTHSNQPIVGANVVHSVAEAIKCGLEYDRCFVIGGASIYRELFPFISRVYVTKIEAIPYSDAFFPNLDEDPEWIIDDEGPRQVDENGIHYRFVTYSRKD